MFVGAGPGAPDLLTLRAVERLRTAEVIVHDALVPLRVLDEVNLAAERIPVAREQEMRPNPGVATGRLLAKLALEDKDFDIRNSAVKNLTDQAFLTKVAFESSALMRSASSSLLNVKARR